MKKDKKSFFDAHKYSIFGLILFLLFIAVICSGTITFARYSSSGFNVGQSVLAQYKFYLTPFQTGNIVAKYDSANKLIDCSYGFYVRNYDSSSISQISYKYTIYFIVPQDLSACLDSANLKVLDDNLAETSQSYAFVQSNIYSEGGKTFYVYKSDYENSFFAGQQNTNQYSVDFVLKKTNINTNGSETYKIFDGIKVQAYATQIL